MNKDKQFNFHEIRGEIPFRISTKKEKGRERERKKEKGEREERKDIRTDTRGGPSFGIKCRAKALV